MEALVLHTPAVEKMPINSVGDEYPGTLLTAGVHHDGSLHETEVDNPKSNRPERRAALVAREMVRFKVDIAALSETRFSEQCQLDKVGVSYTSFWSGRPKTERWNAGVAFATLNDNVRRLPCLPQGIDDRPIILRLSLRGGKFATIVSIYALPHDQPLHREIHILRGSARSPGSCVEDE
nr:unnamed protein product [Spirometra erinaceieuropaei]